MSLFGPPQVGDWVKAKEQLPVTFTDHLLDSGLKPGTRGVVTSGPSGFFNPRVEVDFDSGFGGRCHASVPVRHLRVVRRGGGVDSFEKRSELLGAARLGVAVVTLAPVAWFAVQYVIANRSTDGLVAAFALGALYGVGDLLAYALCQPLQAGLYLLVSWALWKFAFH